MGTVLSIVCDPSERQPGGEQHTPLSNVKLIREGLLSRKSAGSSFRLLSCMDLSRQHKEYFSWHAQYKAYESSARPILSLHVQEYQIWSVRQEPIRKLAQVVFT